MLHLLKLFAFFAFVCVCVCVRKHEISFNIVHYTGWNIENHFGRFMRSTYFILLEFIWKYWTKNLCEITVDIRKSAIGNSWKAMPLIRSILVVICIRICGCPNGKSKPINFCVPIPSDHFTNSKIHYSQIELLNNFHIFHIFPIWN